MINNTKAYFITGTDTNIGKTTAACLLMLESTARNLKTLGLKPVASGCELKNADNVLYNSDGLLLQNYSNLDPEYTDINPYRFQQPISPHIANTKQISAKVIANSCIRAIEKYAPDICYIEGAGGWLCPLNQHETFADIAKILNIPVILVVGIKLGCLNHTILTYNSIKSSGLRLHGWIANIIEQNNQDIINKNINYIKSYITSPLLNTIDNSKFILISKNHQIEKHCHMAI